jgi:hypothetical protein
LTEEDLAELWNLLQVKTNELTATAL